VLHEWGGRLSYETVGDPRIGPTDALIRVEACGVGLTVLNYTNGNHGRRPEDLPRIPGHEAVGTVVEVGAAVGTLSAGQRVMSYFYLFCDDCDLCRLAHEPLCRRLRGQVGVAADGGYADYLALPARNFLPVPDGVSAVHATAIPDAIATPFHVSRRASIAPGDTVMVVGAAGGVGIHMVQMARAFGGEVIAIDRGAHKLKAPSEFGALAALDGDAPDLRDRVRAVAPAGVAVAIDLVGTAHTLDFCLAMLGPRGRLVLLTTFPGVATEVLPRSMVQTEISIIGSRYASRWEVAQAARLVAARRITPVVSEVVPLTKVEHLHDRLRAGTLLGRGATCPDPS